MEDISQPERTMKLQFLSLMFEKNKYLIYILDISHTTPYSLKLSRG